MYQIYICDFKKAGLYQIGTRPVVVTKKENGSYIVYKITSRERNDKYHVRLNNYMIYGYCDISGWYKLDKKCLLKYIRDCTTSEIQAIDEGIRKFKSLGKKTEE